MNLDRRKTYKELFDFCPTAILEVDYSPLNKLRSQLQAQTVTHIKQFLLEHPAAVRKAFHNIKVLGANTAALKQFHAKNKKDLTNTLVKVFTVYAMDVLIDQCVALLEGDQSFSGECRFIIVKRQYQDLSFRLVVPPRCRKNLKGVVVSFSDISCFKKIERQLKRRAQLDGLTNLLNHVTIMQRLDQELVRAKRYGLSLSCLMVDLDHFKVINDKFGHPKGDALLKRVAHMIKDCIRKSDVIGRYGGDEFLVVLPETTSQNAVYAANRIQKLFSVKRAQDAKVAQFYLSLSIGIAGYPSKNIKDCKDFIALADKAMYEAKKSGRNQIALS